MIFVRIPIREDFDRDVSSYSGDPIEARFNPEYIKSIISTGETGAIINLGGELKYYTDLSLDEIMNRISGG